MIKDKFDRTLIHGNTKYHDFYDYFFNELPTVDYVPITAHLDRKEYEHLFEKCMYVPIWYNGDVVNQIRVLKRIQDYIRGSDIQAVNRNLRTDFMIWKMKRKK